MKRGAHRSPRRGRVPARLAAPLVVGFCLGLLAGPVASASPGPWAAGTLDSVPDPFDEARVAAVAVSGGVGFTESLAGAEGLPVPAGGHLRLEGSAAAAWRPAPWLTTALRLDGRYDRHPEDDLGEDDGWTGVPWLLLRAATELGPGRGGAELRWGVPGWEAPDLRPEASVLESRLFYGWRACETCLGLVASVGYRLDRSAEAVPDPRQLRAGDLSALGASDFDAALLELGARLPLGEGLLWAAGRLEVLLGEEAPPASRWPAAIAAGYRLPLATGLQVGVGASVRPTAAPLLDPEALAPVRPRLRAWALLSMDLSPRQQPLAVQPAAEAAPERAPATAPPPRPVLRLVVRDAEGAPLAEATVRLLGPDGEPLAEARSDARGRVALPLEASWPSEGLSLQVEADGFEPLDRPVQTPDEAAAELAVSLRPVPPMGELRGLVRSFAGRPLQATVRVSPGDHELRVDEEGRFELPLPPGDYEVEVRAPGYTDQRRRIRIEADGVTVLNVELRRSRRR